MDRGTWSPERSCSRADTDHRRKGRLLWPEPGREHNHTRKNSIGTAKGVVCPVVSQEIASQQKRTGIYIPGQQDLAVLNRLNVLEPVDAPRWEPLNTHSLNQRHRSTQVYPQLRSGYTLIRSSAALPHKRQRRRHPGAAQDTGAQL